MTDESKGQLLNAEFRRALYRALLRYIPLVPGPELLDVFDAARRSRESVDSKIDQALEALRSASNLVTDLEVSLKDRTEKLTRLKDEVDRYSKLAEIEEGKVQAMLAQVDLTLRRGQGRERWISLAINLVAGLLIFTLGIIAAPALTRWWQGFTGDTSASAPSTRSEKGSGGASETQEKQVGDEAETNDTKGKGVTPNPGAAPDVQGRR